MLVDQAARWTLWRLSKTRKREYPENSESEIPGYPKEPELEKQLTALKFDAFHSRQG